MAVGVDEDVGGLQVPVQQLRGVEVLQGTQDLECDEAQVDGLQHALSHEGVQVGLHELKGHIQVSVILGSNYPV